MINKFNLKRSITVGAIALTALGIGGVTTQNASANSNVHSQALNEFMDKDYNGTLSPQEHANHEQDVKDARDYEQAYHKNEVREASHDAGFAATLKKSDPSLYRAHKLAIIHGLSNKNTAKNNMTSAKHMKREASKNLHHLKHEKKTKAHRITISQLTKQVRHLTKEIHTKRHSSRKSSYKTSRIKRNDSKKLRALKRQLHKAVKHSKHSKRVRSLKRQINKLNKQLKQLGKYVKYYRAAEDYM